MHAGPLGKDPWPAQQTAYSTVKTQQRVKKEQGWKGTGDHAKRCLLHHTR